MAELRSTENPGGARPAATTGDDGGRDYGVQMTPAQTTAARGVAARLRTRGARRRT